MNSTHERSNHSNECSVSKYVDVKVDLELQLRSSMQDKNQSAEACVASLRDTEVNGRSIPGIHNTNGL